MHAAWPPRDSMATAKATWSVEAVEFEVAGSVAGTAWTLITFKRTSNSALSVTYKNGGAGEKSRPAGRSAGPSRPSMTDDSTGLKVTMY